MNWLKSIITITAVILMLVGAGLILGSQRSLGGWRVMVIKSGSMEPTLPTGSLVITQALPRYQPGEIVTFRQESAGNRLITHRIMGATTDGQLVTKGDANPVVDQTQTSPDSVIGHVVWFLPYLGYLIGWLQTPIGVVVGIVIPGTLLIYEEFRSLYRKLHSSGLKAGAAVGVFVGLACLLQVPGTLASYANLATLSSVGFVTTTWIEPEIIVQRQANDVEIQLNNVDGYDRATIEVRYQRAGEDGEVEEGLQTVLDKELSATSVEIPSIFLGTCSETECIPHQVEGDITIRVILTTAGNNEKIVESSFAW